MVHRVQVREISKGARSDLPIGVSLVTLRYVTSAFCYVTHDVVLRHSWPAVTSCRIVSSGDASFGSGQWACGSPHPERR